ncbi:hypothetical protein AB1N83_009792 [Pleurotus pulmonarius]
MISKYPDPQRWRTGRGDPYDQPCPWYICPAFGEQGALRSVTHSSSLQSTHRRQYILQATPLQRGITSQHDLAGVGETTHANRTREYTDAYVSNDQ